jgi:major vault protein
LFSGEWLIRENGSYLTDTYEQVVEVVKGDLIVEKQALHLRALGNFTDVYGVERKAGQEWIVTSSLS